MKADAHRILLARQPIDEACGEKFGQRLNGGMPVVATIKYRMACARRTHVRRTGENVIGLVGILADDTGERHARENRGRFLVQFRKRHVAAAPVRREGEYVS